MPSALLLAHEGCIEAYNFNGTNISHVANVSTLSPPKNSEHFQSHHFRRSYQRDRGRGRNMRGERRNWQPNHGKLMCQICGINGHVAEICYYRFDKEFVPRKTPSNQQYQPRDNGPTSQYSAAAYTTTTSDYLTDWWFPDS